MPLCDLSPAQQQAFYDRLKEFQMDPSQVIPKVNSTTHPGPITLSADPAVSTLPPHIITVSSLDDMKRLAGNADELYENGTMAEHHDPLPEWPAEKNDLDAVQLSPQENRLIHKAHIAYIYGNSKRVQSYKAIIEKRDYPLSVAAFAIEDLCVDASNSPFTISSNAGQNIGTLTICDGGWLNFEANATWTVQVMQKVSATSCQSIGS